MITGAEGRRFTETDLRRWARQGLITESQLQAILEREGLAPAPAEAGEGLNVPTVLYYLGTSLALLALGVFAAVNWGDLAKEGRIGLILGGMLLVVTAGVFVLGRTPYRRGGGALITIAVGMVTLLFFALGDLFAGPEKNAIFDEKMLAQATIIQTAALAVMLVVLLGSGIGMISLAASAQAVSLVATGTVWWLGDDSFIATTSMEVGLGAILIATGLAARFARYTEHAFWLGLSGQIVFFYSFTAVTMSEWTAPLVIVYVLTFGGFILLSTVLGQLAFLATGVLGVYVFIFRLIAETFRGSSFLPLAIGLVGISLIGLAIAYQRYRQHLPLRWV